jgi:hypothetical protein
MLLSADVDVSVDVTSLLGLRLFLVLKQAVALPAVSAGFESTETVIALAARLPKRPGSAVGQRMNHASRGPPAVSKWAVRTGSRHDDSGADVTGTASKNPHIATTKRRGNP